MTHRGEDRPLGPTLPRRGLSGRAPGAAGTRFSPALGRGLGRVFSPSCSRESEPGWVAKGGASAGHGSSGGSH